MQSNKDDLTKLASFTSDSIQGQVGIGKLKVEDVAIPRAEIVSVQFDMALDNLIDVFRESGLTRLPVFEGTLDTPIGMVHLKDLALKHGFSKTSLTLDLRSMVRPVLFAPPYSSTTNAM